MWCTYVRKYDIASAKKRKSAMVPVSCQLSFDQVNQIRQSQTDRQGAAAYQLGNTSSRTITEVKQR